MPTIAEARQSFTDLLGRAHFRRESIKITRRNTPYARIVSEEDAQVLDTVEEIRQEMGLASIEEVAERFKEMVRKK